MLSSQKLQNLFPQDGPVYIGLSGKTSPSDGFGGIWREFGEFHFERRDLHLGIAAGQWLVAQMRDNTPSEFAGYKVVNVATLDGTKLFFEDESWILFRQSGTEPVLRIYCEATTVEKMTKMTDEGERLATA